MVEELRPPHQTTVSGAIHAEQIRAAFSIRDWKEKKLTQQTRAAHQNFVPSRVDILASLIAETKE